MDLDDVSTVFSPAGSCHSQRRKRGRPTAELAGEISRAILAAATRHFLARGYDDTTMEAIAATAGVPKSTLYKRHGDKQSLLRAVVEERLAVWSQCTARVDPASPLDLAHRLKWRAEMILAWAVSAEVQATARLAKAESPGAVEIARLLHEAGYPRVIDTLRQDIVDCSGSDPAPVQDPTFIASTLMALLAGWLITASPGGGTGPADGVALAHRSVELLIHGRQRW